MFRNGKCCLNVWVTDFPSPAVALSAISISSQREIFNQSKSERQGLESQSPTHSNSTFHFEPFKSHMEIIEEIQIADNAMTGLGKSITHLISKTRRNKSVRYPELHVATHAVPVTGLVQATNAAFVSVGIVHGAASHVSADNACDQVPVENNTFDMFGQVNFVLEV